ncbi:hypothetical protein CBR_g37163 [Chara braunii]|uniref:Uncharacterized protein n=1 Tax=Chara braunii TaxID=69332 RepID=A0A388LMG1_CHABU|nr:hypothetical protein CBR_g37163 [Chara braunii]|eukprot:GBG83451.1 hypothetical protein CBR_g37163 [Chara braunii]
MVEVEGLVDVVVEVVGVEEVGGGVLLEAVVEEGVVCAVEEGGAAVVTTVMEGLFPSSVVMRSDMDDTVAFMSLREAVMEVWRVFSVWRMAERSGVVVFAGGCSPARLRVMLSTESVRMSDMLMEDAVMSGEEGVEDAAGTDVEDAAAAMAEATTVNEVEAGTAAAAVAAAVATARWEVLDWRAFDPVFKTTYCTNEETKLQVPATSAQGQPITLSRICSAGFYALGLCNKCNDTLCFYDGCVKRERYSNGICSDSAYAAGLAGDPTQSQNPGYYGAVVSPTSRCLPDGNVAISRNGFAVNPTGSQCYAVECTWNGNTPVLYAVIFGERVLCPEGQQRWGLDGQRRTKEREAWMNRIGKGREKGIATKASDGMIRARESGDTIWKTGKDEAG